MVDTEMLKAVIEERGMFIGAIAKKAGMKHYTLARRINGESEFRASEIEAVSRVLNLKASERNAIFFKKDVE